jgi:hypothetical protein
LAFFLCRLVIYKICVIFPVVVRFVEEHVIPVRPRSLGGLAARRPGPSVVMRLNCGHADQMPRESKSSARARGFPLNWRLRMLATWLDARPGRGLAATRS